jgi:hypothetical protein
MRAMREVCFFTSASQMSRAMENCPLSVTRNCPLLG